MVLCRSFLLHECDWNNTADLSENEMFVATAGRWQLVNCFY